jgi:hypothetical protein
MKEMKTAMVRAIEATFDFGPNHKRISYVRILESALDVVNEFYQHAKGSEHVQLIQLMEIHALVMIQFYFDFFFLFPISTHLCLFLLSSVGWQKTGKKLKNCVTAILTIKMSIPNMTLTSFLVWPRS